MSIIFIASELEQARGSLLQTLKIIMYFMYVITRLCGLMEVNEMFALSKVKFVRGDYEEYFLGVCSRIAQRKSTNLFF
jgi:hypothetical protein